MKCFFPMDARVKPGHDEWKRRTSSSGRNALALARGDLDRVDDLGVGGAAAEIAREIVPDLTSSGLGWGLRQLLVMSTKPGVQYPHWNAPASMKASCTGLRSCVFGFASDSTVRTSASSTNAAK